MKLYPAPFCDPVTAFAPFAGHEWAMLLDSAASETAQGRWSFLAVQPSRTVLVRDGRVFLDGREQPEFDPFAILAKVLADLPIQSPPDDIPFAGGAVGLLAYELGRHLETAPARYCPLPDQPELALGIYDSIVIFDLWERKSWVSALCPEAQQKAEAMQAHLCQIATRPCQSTALPVLPSLDWRLELTELAYCRQVQRIIDYIAAGDVFQVNMTGRCLAERPLDLDDFLVYRHLRAVNPAPFAAYLRIADGFTLASASPERFLSLSRDGVIQARPIKGTRPRCDDPEQDQAFADALRHSRKDNAENLMIADLLRNDIGRVAEIGTVRVPTLCGLESYASVHHLVSVVEARLRQDLGPTDLLRATFPGGSITGAPKVRAMEIIDELEPAARGAYCGSVVWIGGDGAMDASIIIRSLILTKDRIIAQAGGGVVSDSDPLAEYQEMRAKLAPALSIFPKP